MHPTTALRLADPAAGVVDVGVRGGTPTRRAMPDDEHAAPTRALTRATVELSTAARLVTLAREAGRDATGEQARVAEAAREVRAHVAAMVRASGA